MSQHHVFLSYSRKDNQPEANDGWVTSFHDRLLAQHQRYSGRGLRVFFDKASIDHGADWQRGISQGLRNSVLFIAFLSENYLRSEWCRREWEEYLRLEHTLARGDDGILPVYFEIVPAPNGAKSEARLQQEMAAWIADIQRRNRGDDFILVPWFAKGPEVLRELDAAERLAELRAHPQSDDRKLLLLDNRLTAIDRAIARRLDRAALAQLAPGNLDGSYSHFVGRHRELRQLHSGLVADRIGLVAAVHGLGGQGKTALAIQYAYAYAEHYASGGRWFLPCEGKRDLADALEPVLNLAGLQVPPPAAGLSEAAAREFTLKALLAALEQRTRGNVKQIELLLSQQPELHTLKDAANRPPVEPRCLLILDNVADPGMLSAGSMARLAREDWLQIIVTTRLDPHCFGGDTATLATIPVDDLPPADALALLREFQPDRRFASETEEAAAKEIVDALGGFTLAIELAAACLQAHARDGTTCVQYLAWLRERGIAATDTHGTDPLIAGRVRYGEEPEAQTNARKQRRALQVSVIVQDTLQRLSPAARHVLDLAAFLPPDMIVIDWLRQAATQTHPELGDRRSELDSLRKMLSAQGGGVEIDAARQLLELLDKTTPPKTGATPLADPWLVVLNELLGCRLLVVTEMDPKDRTHPRLVRLHRLVGEHLLERLDADHRAACAGALVGVVEHVQAKFESTYEHSPEILWLLRPLEETITRLLHEQPESRALAMAAGVAATAEFHTGRLVRAESLFRRCHDSLLKQHAQNPDDSETARVYANAVQRLGDFRARRGLAGDADKALSYYQRGLDVHERLLAANPESALAARDVSVSLSKLADFLANRGMAGDADKALSYYQRGLEVAERLLAANPESAQAARDVSVSSNNLADFLANRGLAGDADKALSYYQRDLDISERLLAANPESAQAARDVSVSLNKLADFLANRGLAGDADKALSYYQRGLDVAERLLADNPESALAARDVSVNLNTLADFLANRGLAGDADKALSCYQRGLDVRERLLAANPESGEAARDVSVSLNKLADFLANRGLAGDADKALSYYQRGLDVRERLLAANPESAQAARDVSISLEKMADFLAKRGLAGDADKALSYYQRGLDVRERLLAANPESGLAARDVMVSHFKLFRLHSTAGNQTKAMESLAKCFSILDSFAHDGRPMDPQMLRLYEQLKPMFGGMTQP